MRAEHEVRGTLTVVVQVAYRKPGDSGNCTWHKAVTVHREMHVTMDQAQEVLAKWKACNPEAIGSFQAGLY